VWRALFAGSSVSLEPCRRQPGRFTSPSVEPVLGLDIDSGQRSTATSVLCSLGRTPWPDFEGTRLGRYDGIGSWGSSRAPPGVLVRKLPRRSDGIGRVEGTHGSRGGICPRFEGEWMSRSDRFGESRRGSAVLVRMLGRPGSSPTAKSTSRWTSCGQCEAAAWKSPRGARDALRKRSSRRSRVPREIFDVSRVSNCRYTLSPGG
jgi:hypothetical protein